MEGRGGSIPILYSFPCLHCLRQIKLLRQRKAECAPLPPASKLEGHSATKGTRERHKDLHRPWPGGKECGTAIKRSKSKGKK